MKVRKLGVVLAAIAAGAALYAYQDKKQDKAPQMEIPQPSAEHKVLQRAVGTWDALVDMHAGEPSKGTMMVEAGPGGFSAVTHFKSTMMGGPFEGRGIDAYDTNKKKFVSIWTDSWSASPMSTEGTWDEKAQTMSMFGDMPDPMSGKMVKHHLVTKWADADHMTFEILAPGADGKEAEMMKISYSRKK